MFFKEAVLKFSTIGALAPFSHVCVNTFLRYYIPTVQTTLVELGGGTGVFSKEIVARLPEQGHLTTYEINESFFPSYTTLDRKKFTLRTECASTVSQSIAPQSVDIVLSTLPFMFLDKTLSANILQASQTILKPGGTFCLFQYSPLKQAFFEETLSQCRLEKKERIFRNFPPALFFVFRKY